MNKKAIIAIGLAGILAFVFGGTTWAQDLKTRMRDRLPKIVELKAKQVIGENNQGYLDIRKEGEPQNQIVMEENQDRRKVYEAIAKQTDTSADIVGRAGPFKSPKKPTVGMASRPSGRWYQKP